jgi:hypothetical protein
MPLTFLIFDQCLVGRAAGLRRAPRPAPWRFGKIRRARLRAVRRRSVCTTKVSGIGPEGLRPAKSVGAGHGETDGCRHCAGPDPRNRDDRDPRRHL